MIAEGEDLRGTHPRDMIDVLLGNGNDELTDELISDNMIDFMIPAEDSVPVLITLAVKYLSECPLALQQLEVCICLALPIQTHISFSLVRISFGIHYTKTHKNEFSLVKNSHSLEVCYAMQ